jgi:3-oxoacyl-[acyl-carrier protein] reductase
VKLRDRVALVTGAGSGIGRATALLFAEEGATVVVNDLTLEAAQKTVTEMPAGAPAAHAVAADVSRSDQVRAMFADVEERFGRLDVLVNNAGIGEVGDRERFAELGRRVERYVEDHMAGKQAHLDITVEMPDEQWTRMIEVNLNGVFYCMREALKLMARQGSGSIVNLSSVSGLGGQFFSPHYSAAKAGVLGLTKAVAQEVATRGIRVNAICPGLIDTPMSQSVSQMLNRLVEMRIPLGRKGDPREVAQVALFLASDASSYLTGQWISPNGGLYIAP